MLGNVAVTPLRIDVFRVEVFSVETIHCSGVLSAATFRALRCGLTVGIGTVRSQRIADHRSSVLPTSGLARLPGTLLTNPITMGLALLSANRLLGCPGTPYTLIRTAIGNRFSSTLLTDPITMDIILVSGNPLPGCPGALATVIPTAISNRIPSVLLAGTIITVDITITRATRLTRHRRGILPTTGLRRAPGTLVAIIPTAIVNWFPGCGSISAAALGITCGGP